MLLMTDSYKVSHWKLMPQEIKDNGAILYSYFESRGGKFKNLAFFGLQGLLKKHFSGQIVTSEAISYAEEFFHKHFNSGDLFNKEGWNYILKEHGGRLPLKIKAVKEGSVIPTSHVLMTVENTDPRCYWLTSYVETLLMQLWYPITVATHSFSQLQQLEKFFDETACDQSKLPFMLHDFGYRGVSSHETAGIGALAHLAVGFMGTDTLAGITEASQFYHEEMAGFSIAASEHSLMTSYLSEAEACQNILCQTSEDSMVAIVIDSYDMWNFLETILPQFKHLIEKRKVVVRPDSGEPPETVCKTLEILGRHFGYHVNAKGFKVLPEYIRVIHGDRISGEMILKIFTQMKADLWSIENVCFGSGGALLQHWNRDTLMFAYKASHILHRDGREQNIFKSPIHSPLKHSKKGRLTLEKDPQGNFRTVEEGKGSSDLLETVFLNGQLTRDDSLRDIRARFLTARIG